MKDNQEIAKDYTEWMVKTGGYARDKTLRDEFAGLAMQAHLAMLETATAISTNKITSNQLCGGCYAWADAMLKERAK